MKLVHAADIHLDSPMRGLAAYDGAPAQELRLATRVALRNLVDLCLDERADVLLIAGDLYDGDWHDYATGACFVREAQRLADAGIPVVTVTGNHDAASTITRSLRLPDNIHVLPDDAPGTVVFDELGLAVHGQGYAQRVVAEDLSAAYPAPRSGLVNVGLLHTSADGRPGHEPYAPCRVERLAAHGYDYWALGHVHEREVLHADPPIVFAGCLQGRHVRETGPKGATVVTFGADGRPELEPRVLDHVRWAACVLDAGGLDDVDAVLEASVAAVRAEVEAADGRLLAARLRVVGASAAHAELVRAGDALAWELRGAAGDGVWIEQVQVRTTRPAVGRAGDGEGDDVLAELERALASAAGDADALDELAAELAPVAAKLPAELRAVWDPTDPAVVAEMLGDVGRTLPVRLLEGGAA